MGTIIAVWFKLHNTWSTKAFRTAPRSPPAPPPLLSSLSIFPYGHVVDIRLLDAVAVAVALVVVRVYLYALIKWTQRQYWDPNYSRCRKIDSNSDKTFRSIKKFVVDRFILFGSMAFKRRTHTLARSPACPLARSFTLLSYCSYFPLNDFQVVGKHCVVGGECHFWHSMLNWQPMKDSQGLVVSFRMCCSKCEKCAHLDAKPNIILRNEVI